MPGRTSPPTAERRAVRRDALGIGLYALAFGASFGAVSVASGLDLLQTSFLSLVMFSGASQFALVGVVASGGSVLAAAAAALVLGARNAFYGVRLATLLPRRDVRPPRSLLTGQLVIDETTAMALGRDDPRTQRYAFWVTGALLFVLWNVGTLAGAVLGRAAGDPQALGLDAAAPAAFLALLWPRLGDRTARAVAVGAALGALALTPVAPAGVPVLAAAVVPVLAVITTTRPRRVTA
ncbi:MAG TPA: AzlC family ABC transporter permease [Jiangellales bacterium]|nr:AzlC family ABC transporter permease [Jiangellales bacterium]